MDNSIRVFTRFALVPNSKQHLIILDKIPDTQTIIYLYAAINQDQRCNDPPSILRNWTLQSRENRITALNTDLFYVFASNCFFFSEELDGILQRSRQQQHDDNLRIDALRTTNNIHVEEANQTQCLRSVCQWRHISDDLATHFHTGAANGPNRLPAGSDALPDWSSRRSPEGNGAIKTALRPNWVCYCEISEFIGRTSCTAPLYYSRAVFRFRALKSRQI